jgi:nitric oxide dioxygenase
MSETLPAEPTQLLSAESKKVVAATAEVVGEHAEQITAVFYPRMFAEHPELLRVFNQGNQATGEQSRALAASVVAYAVQLVDPGAPSSRTSCAGSPTSTRLWESGPSSTR